MAAMHGNIKPVRSQVHGDHAAEPFGGTGDERDGSRRRGVERHDSYNALMHLTEPGSVSAALRARVDAAIAASGGCLPFDRFMAIALYEPGLGYYANASRKFGWMPSSGSDFVTAPELSPLFGAALSRQLLQALEASGTDEIWEFGAGSGALAAQLLEALGQLWDRSAI